MNIDVSKIFKFLFSDWSVITLAFSIVFLGLAVFLQPGPIPILLCSLLAFASFDAIGYQTVRKIGGDNLIGYRICQTAFQWMVSILATSLSGGLLWVGVGYTLLWWIGVCDWLYYILRKEYGYIEFGDMFWLWWTPQGIINKYINRKNTGKELLIISILGTILWICLYHYVDLAKTLTMRDLFNML